MDRRVAALRLVGSRVEAEQSIRYRLSPGGPIPASAIRIHGIDDAAVSNAPKFSEIWPELSRFIGRTTVIGHTVGFDLAILERECGRAGVAWIAPRTLDVRLLAEIAEPSLPDYSLDTIAAWLGIESADRHSAFGDAVAAARIFVALVPRLRERRIRTLAEAHRASRALLEAPDRMHGAGGDRARRGSRRARMRQRRHGSTAAPMCGASAT